MRIILKILVLSILATLCACATQEQQTVVEPPADEPKAQVASSEAAAPEPAVEAVSEEEFAAIDGTVSAVAGYKSGDNREKLFAVEELVRKTHGRPACRARIEQRLIELLEKESSPDAKLFICRQLFSVGTDVSVPALSKQLSDPASVDMACYALAGNSSDVAGQALRDVLASKEPCVLIAVADLVGARRDALACDQLAKLATHDDDGVAVAAIDALGRIGGAESVKALDDLRAASTDKRRRGAACDALLRCARIALAEGRNEEAVAIWKNLAGPGESEVVRASSLVGLSEASSEDALPLVIPALREDSRILKAAAVRCIREMKGTSVGKLMEEELPKLPPADQVLLIGALASRGGSDVKTVISRSAGSANEDVRVAALGALRQVGDASSLPLLITAAAGQSKREGGVAMASIVGMRVADADSALITFVNKGPAAERRVVIEALAHRKADAATPALLQAARDEDPGVRIAALESLTILAAPKDMKDLAAVLLKASSQTEMKAAEKAVVATAGRNADKAVAADELLSRLPQITDTKIRCSVIRALGGIANDKVLAALVKEKDSEQSEARDAAVRALAEWPDARVYATLRDMAIAGKNETQRVLALRGAARVLPLDAARSGPDTVAEFSKLMGAAKKPDERKMVLAGMAELKSLEALNAILPMLKDQTVRMEAAHAVMKVGLTIRGAHPKEAQAAMKAVTEQIKDESVVAQARAAIEEIRRYQDFITSWQVAGPYEIKGKSHMDLFEVAFPPETDQSPTVKWEIIPPSADPNRPWMFDLLAKYGGQQKVAYARTWIHSDKRQRAGLELGTDDSVKVWFNGRPILAHKIERGAAPGQEKVDITLQQGWNSLMLKITQNVMMWDFCAQLRGADGDEIKGVTFDCAHIEEGRLMVVGSSGDFILDWKVAGPYDAEGKQYNELFDIPLGPEKEGEVKWQDFKAGDGGMVGLFEKWGENNNKAAYARTWIFSETEQDVSVDVGSDDGIKVWLNDAVIIADNTNRGAQPGQDHADVVLRKGWNRLTLKITQGGGGWGFCAQIGSPVPGGKLEGVRFDPSKGGEAR
ncbi:MAG TPA: HEAT repeat domain-containing protein [Candidatus Brocadiia bacterium]|nr:HEAT repeat domain-containing protein [Candidatus Brocadiia bacterium]